MEDETTNEATDAETVVETEEDAKRRIAVQDHGETCFRELVALDLTLREHGASIADVVRRAAHNQFGIDLR